MGRPAIATRQDGKHTRHRRTGRRDRPADCRILWCGPRHVQRTPAAPRIPGATALLRVDGALSAGIDFRSFFEWFKFEEDKELRAQKHAAKQKSRELEAVRAAITSMIPGASEPRIEFGPLRFVVSLCSDAGVREELTFDQMGGGYRVTLALAADLARRMVQGNPHRADPCACEAIVLIDEIDLHLHPAWQQRVLVDLLRTFPNTQFLVSTHSPQVLTSVEPERIVELNQDEDGSVVAAHTSAVATFGAESGDVLETVMGVPERPKNNYFVKALRQYQRLVGRGEGESEDSSMMAAAARSELLPDATGMLPRFFTTSRSWFGDLGERLLNRHRQWV